ncbi:MAG: hypothetical protein ACREFX_09615 [Opitutaceae bacterium]
MKLTRLALLLPALFALGPLLRAQDEGGGDDAQHQQPPTEIPDFSNLDEYIYVPRSTVTFGYRFISGVRARFSGNGTVGAPEGVPSEAPNIQRFYHDGSTEPDARSTSLDNGNGTSSSVPENGADGKTNTWSYMDPSQITADGFLQQNIYSATTADTSGLAKTGKANVGMEVTITRDGRKLGKRWALNFFGGLSLSDIQAATFATMRSNMSTLTDTYDLYGQIPPAPADGTAYESPDTNGGQILISSVPLNRTITTQPLDNTITTTSGTPGLVVGLTDHDKLHGAYATIRFGPQLVFNAGDHWHMLFSAGPAILESGSTYTLTEVFQPPTAGVNEATAGNQIIATLQNVTNRLLLGYYVDATLQYDLSDRAGFYLGVFDQSAGGYDQSVNTAGQATSYTLKGEGTIYAGSAIGPTYYTTHIDFTNQNGMRAGMAYKF